jgi:hypothetical protein
VAAVIIPFLLLAFVILYLFPQLSGVRFAWRILPNVTAVYIGAGYLGGAYLFVHALVGRQWHRVAAGFPAVTAFTISMLLATLLHWDRFDPRHLPFQLWLVLYVVTPVLVPWIWLSNRVTDPRALELQDIVVPDCIRLVVRVFGVVLTAGAILGLVFPHLLIAVWPWTLTPLTASVVAGWLALMGVGNLAIAQDCRWSTWRVAVESITLWQVLFLVGAVIHQHDFTVGRLLNWYVLSILVFVLSSVSLYVFMEARRRHSSAV